MPRFSVLARALENESSKFNSYKGELSTYSSKINTIKKQFAYSWRCGKSDKSCIIKK